MRPGFMLDWGRDLGPALIAGPNACFPEAVIGRAPDLLLQTLGCLEALENWLDWAAEAGLFYIKFKIN